MYLKIDAYHAIYHIIGIQMLINVFHVHLHLNTIYRQDDVFAQVKDLILLIVNVLLANCQIIGIKQQIIARFAHNHLNMIHIREAAFAQLEILFYKEVDALHALIQIIGI